MNANQLKFGILKRNMKLYANMFNLSLLFISSSQPWRKNILHVHLPPGGRHCQPLHLPLSTHRQSRRKVLTNQEYWQHLNAPLLRQLQVKNRPRRIPKRKKRRLNQSMKNCLRKSRTVTRFVCFVGYVQCWKFNDTS